MGVLVVAQRRHPPQIVQSRECEPGRRANRVPTESAVETEFPLVAAPCAWQGDVSMAQHGERVSQ